MSYPKNGPKTSADKYIMPRFTPEEAEILVQNRRNLSLNQADAWQIVDDLVKKLELELELWRA